MPVDHTYPVRRGLIQLLKADAGVSVFVGSRVYPSRAPAGVAWPFIRVFASLSEPWEATGYDGSNVTGQISGFSHDESECQKLMKAVSDALEGNQLPLDTEKLISLQWSSTQYLDDPDEPDGVHGLTRFTVITSE